MKTKLESFPESGTGMLKRFGINICCVAVICIECMRQSSTLDMEFKS